MRGHVRRRGSRWAFVVELPRDEDGKRKQKWHSGFSTKREAERALAEQLGRLERGDYIVPSRITFGSYLEEIWLPAIAASVRPSTLARYSLDVKTLQREVGSVRLQVLAGAELDALYVPAVSKHYAVFAFVTTNGKANLTLHQREDDIPFFTAIGTGTETLTATLHHGVRLEAHGHGTVDRAQLAVIPLD